MEILPVHALTVCDTVACYFRIGKGPLLRCCECEPALILCLIFGVADAPMENY